MLRLAFLAFAAMTIGTMPNDPPALLDWGDLLGRPRPAPDATLSYGADPLQQVDVWIPKGAGPFKTVLMVHGGCWTTDIATRDLMNWVADDLRHAGYAVWNIEYRGVDRPGGGYPGTFADVAAAADALATHAARFHLDASRIVAVGHSAGGHLALWLAARHKLPASNPLRGAHPLPIAHVVSLGGLPDLEAAAADPKQGCGTEVVARLVGPPLPTHRDVYADTSVPRLLPLGVPQDLVNGAQDSIIPPHHGTGYVARAQLAGDAVNIRFVPATGHVELVAPETAAWAATKDLIGRAFARK
ncbi:alpha/beta hydrolase [Sphingomonas sp. AR_OL41]|uniref:alpha/beta hydrolase family protein n=1 Tax=Sphingomonas sp. AR_OL41 TaxID=3042729 RepID=UPI0024810078|nr:alpha/beta hydrolase [Sphingomonas sp. AR_OL41]MDH7976004.1 alpha/beta hydrolase [Sphingomonas sp. AR_OL41]